MMKFKLFLLCFFIFLNTTAQNPNSQIIDTLNNSLENIYNQINKSDPKEFSKLTHLYLNNLNSIEKSYLKAQKKKKLKEKKIHI